MTPGSRIQSTIELLESIYTSWQSEKRFPADKLLENYFKSHRFIGSKDRAYIGELVYWCLRHKASLEWWLSEKLRSPVHGRAIVISALMLRKEYTVNDLDTISQDGKYSLAKLTEQEKTRCQQLYKENIFNPTMPEHVRLNYPEWLSQSLHESFGKNFEAELLALNEQAPTDLRVNTLKTTREQLQKELQNEGFETEPTKLSPIGLRLKKRAPIFTSAAFKLGHFEVQDEGSQIVASLVQAKPGMKVIDFCAGAGGKTLAIAAQMQNKGRILAWDTSEKRLAQMKQRIKRAGVDNVQMHVITSESDAFIKRHKHSADVVLVDAPCSGTGTWRRNPDLKWRFSAQDLQEVTGVQQSILQSAARLVKPGGYLVYATCSVLRNENENQVTQFLKSGNNFTVVCGEKIWDKIRCTDEIENISFVQLTPHKDGADGFFAAALRAAGK